MAKAPTEDGKRPRGKAQEAAVWTLMGMLILGLGGFGVTSFSGGVSKIASVGDIEITGEPEYAVQGIGNPITLTLKHLPVALSPA